MVRQTIHTGKNEPKTSTDGAREQPVDNTNTEKKGTLRASVQTVD
jgi:hypothetical protein